jgi:hypothetical protein
VANDVLTEGRHNAMSLAPARLQLRHRKGRMPSHISIAELHAARQELETFGQVRAFLAQL